MIQSFIACFSSIFFLLLFRLMLELLEVDPPEDITEASERCLFFILVWTPKQTLNDVS